MVDGCAENGTKLVISHQRRFTPGWEKAKLLIEEGIIGTPLFVTNKVADGLNNWGTHSIDGSRFVLRDPAAEWVMGAVERRTDRYERDIRIEDKGAGIVGFDNGTVGQLLLELEGTSGWPGHRQGGIFYGEDGILDLTEQKIRLLSSQTGGWEDRPIEGEDPSVGQMRELVEWIEGQVEHRGQAENGRAAVEIIMAIYESARLGAPVKLPLLYAVPEMDEQIATKDRQI